MYIAITRQQLGDNFKGSARDFVNYLEKENEGKVAWVFATQIQWSWRNQEELRCPAIKVYAYVLVLFNR